MSDQGPVAGVWREAMKIVGRYPAATIIPGAILGTIAEAPHYFAGEQLFVDNILTYATAALAYFLYLAYAEEIVVEYERETEHIGLRGVVRELRDATSYVWRTLAAGLTTLVVTSLAAGLLIIPGAWLYTRWSLAIPAIRHQNLGPTDALKRSNTLAKSRFWFVFATATLAFVAEETLVHVGATGGYLVFGSHTWGEWIGGSVVAAVAIPLAAFTTSIAYQRATRAS